MLTKSDAIVHSQVWQITPDLAKQWLEGHTHNRPLYDRDVDRYAEEMKAGKWVLNGAPIIFDWNGALRDGQHRLWAVFNSGVTIRAVVVQGVDPDTFATLDSGRKRSGADHLIVAGFSFEYRGHVSASLRLIHQYETSQIGMKYTTSPGAIVEAARTHAAVGDMVSRLIKAPATLKGSTSSLSAVLHLGSVGHPDKAELFIEQWVTGAGLDEVSPVLALRQRLLQAKRLRPDEKFFYGATAWNAFVIGRPMHHLKISKNYIGSNFPPISGSSPKVMTP